MYAEMLKVEESLLREVKELCSEMDLDKENLVAKIINLELGIKNSNL